MTLERSDKGFLFLGNKILIGIFLFFTFILSGFLAHSQSYFYFENKISLPQGDSITYYSFLRLGQDGSGILRTRSANTSLVEQTMTDSVFANAADTTGLKYLVPIGSLVNLENGKLPEYKLRFLFKKQTDNTSSYYVPYRTEYAGLDGKWNLATTNVTQEKTYDDLISQKDFVAAFYPENEDFYKYLFGQRERSNSGTVRKEKMFLILLANTNDKTIGVSSTKDLNSMGEMLTTLAANLGMRLSTTKISGENFSKENLELALAKLKKEKPSPADIIVFYYSGHGFRYSNDTSAYPRISFRTNPNQNIDTINVQVEGIFNQIKKLGARLNIVFSDCCNGDIGEPVPVGRDVLKTRGAGFNTTAASLNMNNCNALFFYPKHTDIIATAADIKQLSTGNPALGGFFTYYLKTFLEQSLYGFQTNDSWLRLLYAAQGKTRQQALTSECGTKRCVQLPKIDVLPKR